MKTGILKFLAIAGLTASTFATPASAVNITFNVVNGNELQVVASDLGTDIIAAWDFDITFAAGLTALSAVTTNQLGVTNVETVFDFLPGAGLVDVFEVSLLSDAALDALQNTATLTLVTITFDKEIVNGDFSFVWDDFNDVKCAQNRVCFPPRQQVPEPGTLALLALGAFGLVASRRRRAA